MANIDLNIPINMKLEVDREAAKTCLRLVEIYLNNHDGVGIRTTRREDGTICLAFARDNAQGATTPATDRSAGYAAACC